jgi:hypothetical protein
LSIEFYKIVHILGIMLLFLALGGLLFPALNNISLDKKSKKPWAIIHGISLILILVGGFGLLARLGIKGSFPLWVWLKLIIWSYFSIIVFAIVRLQKRAKWIFSAILLVSLIALIVINLKPV